MTIILYLGRDIKDYSEKSTKIIQQKISEKALLCRLCLRPMTRHSSYRRGVKETGQQIEITMVWCRKCKKYHALLPDFLLRNKHYSGNEIESVILDSDTVKQALWIETSASEGTVRRWVKQVGDSITMAISMLKYLFGQAGRALCETAIDAGTAYDELEQILEMAPQALEYSGNKLGLANIWLGTGGTAAYI